MLLDGNFNGRLGNFGLARLYDYGRNPQTAHLVGTIGYLAPEMIKTEGDNKHECLCIWCFYAWSRVWEEANRATSIGWKTQIVKLGCFLLEGRGYSSGDWSIFGQWVWEGRNGNSVETRIDVFYSHTQCRAQHETSSIVFGKNRASTGVLFRRPECRKSRIWTF